MTKREKASPIVIASQIQDDGSEIGGSLGRIVDPVRRMEETNESFLNQVLGCGTVVGEQSGETNQRGGFLLVEAFHHGATVQRLCRPDHRVVESFSPVQGQVTGGGVSSSS